ncbi:hypothetical protein HK100_000936 [Physocladia obscura]|uniref:Uncharacterized protein n=1 Tax=Physocladia obscura TaxID=109957 RepID=A0AAD5T0E5_9FUNG|nr:hypothetical protein HK100_000936 [Physocladia obscura]
MSVIRRPNNSGKPDLQSKRRESRVFLEESGVHEELVFSDTVASSTGEGATTTAAPTRRFSSQIRRVSCNIFSQTPDSTTMPIFEQLPVVSRIPPHSAPVFTRTGYRLSLPLEKSNLSSSRCRPKTAISASTHRPYRVAPVSVLGAVSTENCKSKLYPRKQRRIDEVKALEEKIICQHILDTTGLNPIQIQVLNQTLKVGEHRRTEYKKSCSANKCWPPQLETSPSLLSIQKKKSAQVCFGQICPNDEDYGIFAEEFKRSDDDEECSKFNYDLQSFSHEFVLTPPKNEILEFPLITPVVAIVTDDVEITFSKSESEVSMKSTPQADVEYNLNDGNSDKKYEMAEQDIFEKTSVTSRRTSAFSSTSSVSFARNKLFGIQDEKSDEIGNNCVDFKKIYSKIVDPQTIRDSFLNNLPNIISNEDAVAETEMKIVLRDLQIWAEHKYTPLFSNTLDEPKQFLQSFISPEPAMSQRSSLVVSPNSLSSNLKLSPTFRPSTATKSFQRSKTSTSCENLLNSSAVADDIKSSQEFDELLLLTPWKPKIEETKGNEDGKGVRIEEYLPKTLVKRLKENGVVTPAIVEKSTISRTISGKVEGCPAG